MNINTKSWHYHIVDTYSLTDTAYDICSYIRSFLVGLIFIGVLIFLSVLAVMLAVSPFLFFLVGNLLPEDIISLAIFGTMIYVFLIIIGLFKLTTISYHKIKRTEVFEKSTNNPFMQYIKAKHDKVCTFIEYK